MKLFDFSLLAGGDARSAGEGTREALADYLNREDAGGVVTSLAGAYYDYAEGNAETLALARGDGRLLAGLTVDPRRVDAQKTDFAAAKRAGFRALVLFPAIQRWGLSHPAVAGLVERAGEEGLPVIIHVGRSESVAALCGVAQRADVAVTAVGIAYASLGEVMAGAQETANLLLGMSLFAGLGNVEALCETLGPERLVMDSGEPRWSAEPALEVLGAADIGDAALEAITVGNARRIFGVGG
jgi:predicted TIM-barrel fold metal-dependent hydrolase